LRSLTWLDASHSHWFITGRVEITIETWFKTRDGSATHAKTTDTYASRQTSPKSSTQKIGADAQNDRQLHNGKPDTGDMPVARERFERLTNE
jgi:hypothetical protein